MTTAPGRLREIELFAGLGDEQLAWVARVGRPVRLTDRQVLFEDGEPARHFYVLLTGELLITKVIDGREQVVARHRADPPDGPRDGKPRAADQYTGELPLLTGEGYLAKATAVGRVELLAYDRPCFLDMLARCPQIGAVLFPVLAWRIHSYEVQASRVALLSGLGGLAAGLAHELNNPAAAAVRAAGELRRAVPELAAWSVRWGLVSCDGERRALGRVIDALSSDLLGTSHAAMGVAGMGAAGVTVARVSVGAGALADADAADQIVDWLTVRGLDESGELGAVLTDQAVPMAALTEVEERIRPEALGAAVGCLALSLHVRALSAEVSEAGQRIQDLVDSAKSYTNLDRAPEREVDVREGVEATLAMLAPRLGGIKVHHDHAALPMLAGYPGDLNQVWTNLINNAVDAMGGSGELRISTRMEGGSVVVEFRDDGAGIPPEALSRVFQPFFTTKDIGRGTGLGLHLSREIVTQRHNGSIEVTSEPGDTRFTVRLPLRPAAVSAIGAAGL
ncbi:cyclic nucleotide-binding domain-containing protein [Actinomadura barringtoniae]|uniref:histidine kinase n=1 Tax=Actinomadura barringtoniae TaxID=1427535 RepID=A0A939PER1_9ACTN|nr:ATP-binding protein [Actinomadura barringtoniae]MBO2448773.1 cyclic nucleotide-binding domain-containing protein [Actinomadura barringtoniae]